MLQITIPGTEQWDEKLCEFVYTKEQTLRLEHSLVSLAKWESKWCKPFFSSKEKTHEETMDYVRCMTITQNIKPEVYGCLTNENILAINDYIGAPMTATYMSEERGGRSSREVVTSELIYYWMITLGIPLECEKWHLNRLFTLIKVCSRKNSPPKKRSRNELIRDYAAINEANKRRFNSKG